MARQTGLLKQVDEVILMRGQPFRQIPPVICSIIASVASRFSRNTHAICLCVAQVDQNHVLTRQGQAGEFGIYSCIFLAEDTGLQGYPRAHWTSKSIKFAFSLAWMASKEY